MFQSSRIEPLRPEDIPALRTFLLAGFGLSELAASTASDVLMWKYFDPCGFDNAPRSLLAFNGSSLVGHVGMCPRRFISTDPKNDLGVSTVHFIDWLASPAHPSVGLGLMMRGFNTAEVQYAVGGSPDGQQMAARVGYKKLSDVGFFHKIIRPGYRIHSQRYGIIGGILRAVKDLGRVVAQRRPAPARQVDLLKVTQFGDEVDDIVARCEMSLCMTSRNPTLLNHYLRHPRGIFDGWMLRERGKTIGFAMTSLQYADGCWQGRIVECFLTRPDAELWHAAIVTLTDALAQQSADVALGYGSTPWSCAGFGAAGFTRVRDAAFQLRDRRGLLRHDSTFHITPLEADYGYLI